MSIANGAIRPSGSSYREALAKGQPKDNGHEALNQFLDSTLGNLVYQEQIMEFLTKFCNHSGAEADTVRRGLSKKEGTEQFLPKIREEFIKNMTENYGDTPEHAEEILQSFLNVIHDAQRYGFSINHSQPYSYIGYVGAWLRYHYPLEFLSAYLNIAEKDKETASEIIAYMKARNIELKPIEFGKSDAKYSFSHAENCIYKGIASIKYLNSIIARELLELSKNKYDNWIQLLVDIADKTSCDTRQMEILIRLDFFKSFGAKEILLETFLVFSDKQKANTKKYPEFADRIEIITKRKRNKETKQMEEVQEEKVIKKPLKYSSSLKENTKAERIKNNIEYFEAVTLNPPAQITIYEQILFEKDSLGYAVSIWETLPHNLALVLDMNLRYTPVITLYKLATGEEITLKVEKKSFWNYDEQLLYNGDIIAVTDVFEKGKWRKDGNRWIQSEEVMEMFLGKCKIVRKSNQRPFLS